MWVGPQEILEPYPSGGSYVVPADTVRYTYYTDGNLLTANNRDAKTARTYYSNGSVRTERQQIRTLNELSAGGNFTSHDYTLTYTYDRNGRRAEILHPENLSPRVGGLLKKRTRYQYHSFGPLAMVTDILGHEYRYTYTARAELDSVYLPRNVKQRFTYDPDGNLATHTMRDWNGALVRDVALRYDGRGRQVRSRSTVGLGDTLTVELSGLGHIISSELISYGKNSSGQTVKYHALEAFGHDALGNLRAQSSDGTTTSPGPTEWIILHTTHQHDPATGRLEGSVHDDNGDIRVDSLWYDPAGNVTFTYQTVADAVWPLTDRASVYDAEGRLRAADYRHAKPSLTSFAMRVAFEEYRYDALGRRVWVRTRGKCWNETPPEDLDCNRSVIRRTVWDGQQELWEIQMPGQDLSTYLEKDTATVDIPLSNYDWDTHPFFGRVVFTHGLGLDQPVGITRMGYVDDRTVLSNRVVFAPFSVVPGWNLRGDPDWQYIAENLVTCTEFDTPSSACVWVESSQRWWAYGTPRRTMGHWYGTLIENKADRTGTFYRRNRYYDPSTGRFTQEDPIGLAGGLNLYGYANGDPVNFSDPFGLCPMCYVAFEVGASIYDLGDLAVTGIRYFRGRASGADLSITAAGAGAGIFGFGGGYGRAGRAALTRYGDEVFAMAQSGGRHSGFLANYAGRSVGEIRRAQRSLGRHISQHESYLANPTSKVNNFYELSDSHQQRLIEGWKAEVRNASDQIEILERIR